MALHLCPRAARLASFATGRKLRDAFVDNGAIFIISISGNNEVILTHNMADMGRVGR